MKKYTIHIVFVALLLAWSCTGVVPGTCPPCPVCPPTDTTVVVVPPPGTTGKAAIGVNTFPWIPIEKLTPFGSVRIYIGSHWIWRPGGLFIQPMFQAETEYAHGIDEYLTKCKSAGIDPLLCIHQTPEWYVNTGRDDGGNDYPPVKTGMSRTDPKSYKDYASMLFQVAARYGRQTHPPDKLRVDVTPRWSGDVVNTKKTALDLCKYIEPWNETDKWWKRQQGQNTEYFTPDETAAMMSACYDGHEGTLGAGAGIKVADPSMVVVMPGLTDFDVQYITKLDLWFKANRKDKKWPCDVFNLHHYSNTGNAATIHPPTWNQNGACVPALDKNFSGIKFLVGFARANGMKTWITEFGADSKNPSQMGAGSEAKQAEIITETYKAYFAEGVERCFVFMAADEPGAASAGLWQTCGVLTNRVSGYAQKESWFAVEKLSKESK